jgi:hypothetical protein
VTARPLDAARDALIVTQAQVIAALAARVAQLEAANADLSARGGEPGTRRVEEFR